jgi:drug/metabolite transporter (DMT)-like permease
MAAMSTTAFLLILISSLMHALWNLFVKQSHHKTVFIWWMFVCSAGLFTTALPFLPGVFPRPDTPVVLLAAVGAACFVLYHLFTGRAYRGGDLSLTYPLAQTSMIYVPLWGGWLLGERMTPIGLGGIALIILGAYLVQMQHFSSAELLRPFRSLGNPPVQAALAAGFIYSVGAIIDKSGVMRYSPLFFTYLLVLFMLFFMTLNLLRPRYRSQIGSEWRDSRLLILVSGPVLMGSFLSFRYGLSLAPMSYAVPVRQVSVLIGVLIGIAFLGESCGRIRVCASLLILAGVFLVRLG